MKTDFNTYLLEKLRAYHEAESVPRGGPVLDDAGLMATYSGSNVACDIAVAYMALSMGAPIAQFAEQIKTAAVRLGMLGKEIFGR